MDFIQHNRLNVAANAKRKAKSTKKPAKPNSVDNYFRCVKKKLKKMADATLAEAAGVPASSGDPINPAYQYIRRESDKQGSILTFKNVLMMTSWGYSYKNMTAAATTTGYSKITTPLACIPANLLSFYISKADIYVILLVNGSAVIHAS